MNRFNYNSKKNGKTQKNRSYLNITKKTRGAKVHRIFFKIAHEKSSSSLPHEQQNKTTNQRAQA